MQPRSLAKRHDACTFRVAASESTRLLCICFLECTCLLRACADSACPELMLPVVEPQTTAHTDIDSEEASVPWHHQLMAIGGTDFTMRHHHSPSVTILHHASPSFTICHH